MNTRKIILFLVITLILSWSIAGIIYSLELRLQTPVAALLLILYMYMPALSALIVQKFIYRQEMVKPLLISFKINKFFLWAWLLPLVVTVLATGIGFLFPVIHFDPEMQGFLNTMRETLPAEQVELIESQWKLVPMHPALLQLLSGLIAAITINALAAFGEELGWRGFLLNEFRNRSFITATLSIGFIWGLWHAPIILMGHNYAQHPQIGVVFMILFCMLYAFVFNYFTLKSKSVIAAAILHGSINSFAGLPLLISSQASDLLVGVTGAAGLISLLIVIILIFIYDRWVSKEGVFSNTISVTLKG